MTRFLPKVGLYLIKPDRFRASKIIERPDSIAKESPTSGVVVEAFEGASFPVGTRVIFPSWSGTEIGLDGIDHCIIWDNEILGTVQDEVAP